MHDLLFSQDGDLVPDWNGDLSVGDDETIDYQDINFRVMTNDPDCALGNLGANLEDAIGLPNNAATGALCESNVQWALTFDKRFLPQDLTITAVPINESQIGIYVGLTSVSKLKTTAPFLATVVSLNS